MDEQEVVTPVADEPETETPETPVEGEATEEVAE